VADVPIIDLDPYLLAVQATLLLLQQLGLIPDLNPLDYIISAFDGKPKLEDTELAALRLQSSPWWPLRALGNNLQIWVRNGVPLSTGIAADRLELSQWIQGTIDSIEPIVFNRLDPYSLDHAIWLAMTSQFGDQAIRQLNDEIANQHALGPLPTPPPQPTGPPPTPTEVGVHQSRDGDELADYGDTLIFQNSLMYDLVTQIAKGLGGQGTAECCAKVVTAIGAVTTELTALAQAVGGAGSSGDLTAPLDAIFTAINVSAGFLKQLADCVCALEQNLTGSGVDLAPLVNAVNSTRDALAMFEKCVCDALADNSPTGAAVQRKWRELIQLNVSEGLIDAETAQIITS
jgi:hypothetical protein